MAPHSILIIDDDPDVRTVLQLVLKRAGYKPLEAASGHASAVAAILCDLEMPGMDGASVIAHLHARHPMIPIVVLSGAAPAKFLDAAAQQGVGDWLRKPATNDMVLDKVRGAVHLYELRKAGRGTKDRSLT